MQGRHGLAHLLPKRYPISTPDEMYKPIPPPEYVAPTKGDDEFQELSDKFFEEEINVPKGSAIHNNSFMHYVSQNIILKFT